MNEFNISSWMKKQYLTEARTGGSQAQILTKLIDDAVNQVDESLSYKDFAVAVANILKEGYGSHLFDKFMEVLHDELGYEIEESTKVVNEIYMSGRIGTVNISAKELVDKMEEIESMGISVDRFDGSRDGKTNIEFHVYPDGRDNPLTAFSVYDYKFGFDPMDEDHHMEEYPFSVGGRGRDAAINASNYLGAGKTIIKMNESLNEMDSDEQIGNEFAEEFGVRAYSTPYDIKIAEMGDINGNKFETMIKWVESKGYKVDRSQSDNTFDMDEDRYFYPRIAISK